jgi:hypothetical protein
MKTILCSIDLSPFSPAVLRYGAGLARCFGARLAVFHSVYSAEDCRADLVIAALSHPAPGNMTVKTVLAQTPRAEALLEQAERRAADLLVAGVRRQSGIRHVAAGSATEAALRHSPCPVLAVPEPDRPRSVRGARIS